MFTAIGASKRFSHAAIAIGFGLLNAVVGIREVVQDGRTDNLVWYVVVTLILIGGGLLFIRAGLRDLREEATPEPSWMRPGTVNPQGGGTPSPGTDQRDGAERADR